MLTFSVKLTAPIVASMHFHFVYPYVLVRFIENNTIKYIYVYYFGYFLHTGQDLRGFHFEVEKICQHFLESLAMGWMEPFPKTIAIKRDI